MPRAPRTVALRRCSAIRRTPAHEKGPRRAGLSENCLAERNIVVEVVGRRRAGLTAALAAARAGCAAAAAALRVVRRAAATAAAATQHLHLVRDDLGRVAIVAVLVLPLARLQAPFDVDSVRSFCSPVCLSFHDSLVARRRFVTAPPEGM